MMDSLLRRSANPMSLMSTPSIRMEPPQHSTSRNKATPRDDLPEETRQASAHRLLQAGRGTTHTLTNTHTLSLFRVRPDPVLPTMPTFSLGRMVQEILLRTRGRFSWYLISTSFITSSPSCGQSGGGARPLTLAGASWDRD